MKQNKLIYLGLVFLCINSIAWGVQKDRLYELMAKDFLKKLPAKQSSIELNKAALIQFLKDRADNAQKIIAGDTSLSQEELEMLNPNLCLLVTQDHLATDPNARVVYFYSIMARDSAVYTLYRDLKYKSNDTPSDSAKPDTAEKVSHQEFKDRLFSISQDELRMRLLKNSENFANAVLDELQMKSKL